MLRGRWKAAIVPGTSLRLSKGVTGIDSHGNDGKVGYGVRGGDSGYIASGETRSGNGKWGIDLPAGVSKRYGAADYVA